MPWRLRWCRAGERPISGYGYLCKDATCCAGLYAPDRKKAV